MVTEACHPRKHTTETYTTYIPKPQHIKANKNLPKQHRSVAKQVHTTIMQTNAQNLTETCQKRTTEKHGQGSTSVPHANPHSNYQKPCSEAPNGCQRGDV